MKTNPVRIALNVVNGSALAMALALSAGCGGSTTHASYVLVHGSWMGAWAWDDVAPSLRADGSTVTVVELPAHGADQTPVANATLDAYVAAVDAAVEASDEPVVLVGHSMGGVVITQEGENHPDKISRLVYLAGYVPENGQSLFALASTDTGSQLVPDLMVDATTGTAAIATSRLGPDFCAECTTAQLAPLLANYRDEPVAPLMAPVTTTAAGWGSLSKAYIYTTEDKAISPALQQQMVAAASITATSSVDTGHAAFLSQPENVVAALKAQSKPSSR